MPSFIVGSVKEWSGDSGSIESEDGKQYNFTKGDLQATMFSKAFEPKVGDKVIGDPKADDESGIKKVMRYLLFNMDREVTKVVFILQCGK